MPALDTSSRFFARPVPELEELVPDKKLNGSLIVIEGADGSGRSTQIRMLKLWLESKGHSVVQVGLKRSNLAAEALSHAQQAHSLGVRTMSLFYATDFFDQLINTIIPALSASSVVLADRYIYTLMARARVRGMDSDWLQNLYSAAVIPDAVFYFKLPANQLLVRNFQKNPTLDYWESGMDLRREGDMFDSFLHYQDRIAAEFGKMVDTHGFHVIDANRQVFAVQKELRSELRGLI